MSKIHIKIRSGSYWPCRDAAFSDMQELTSVLLDHEEDLGLQLVESMMTCALGRTIEFSDADYVDAVLGKLRDEEHRAGSMIREVARSPLFERK